MKSALKIQKKSKLKLLHQYYSYTGFYGFIGSSVKKSILPLLIIAALVILFNQYVFNINEGLLYLTETFSKFAILITFFISETILGLLPPEIFIGWALKTDMPIGNLALLATLSYFGGITSFFLGKLTLNIDAVNNYLEQKMSKHLKNTSKWGGFLIIVGALLPLPFAITCMAAGMIKYPLKGVVLFGLFRFLRFAFYGYLIYGIIS